MPIRSKIEPARVSASDWQNLGQKLRGLLEGKSLQTNVTLFRYVTDAVGEGPTLHVHPYDEIFMITEGRARFTVGDRTIDAEAGDVILGPANIPGNPEACPSRPANRSRRRWTGGGLALHRTIRPTRVDATRRGVSGKVDRAQPVTLRERNRSASIVAPRMVARSDPRDRVKFI